MGIIELLVIIALIGFLCWALITLIPMPAPFPKAIVIVGIIIVMLVIISAFGLLPSLHQPVPRL